MSQMSKKSSWDSHLPEVFSWIESLDIKTAGSPPADAAHFLACMKETKEKEPGYEIDAPLLPPSVKAGLIEQLNALGHKKPPDLITLLLKGATYTLVQQSSVATDHYRRGRQAGIDAARSVKGRHCEHLVLCEGEHVAANGMLEGLAMGLYSLTAFKGKKDPEKDPLPGKLILMGSECNFEQTEHSRSLALASSLSRMVADAPPSWLNPEKFADIAKKMAKAGGIGCEIRKKPALERLGMGAFISVGNGSVCEPHLIELHIKGESSDKTLVLVGKGLTFDAGGVSLKPSLGMDEMKYDMCGGAAVLGAACYLARHKPPFDVVCLIGAVENLIDSNATRPGDVVTAMNGKTVEVLNTDAEGRLVLADLLSYAEKTWSPEMILDAATLTGSVLHALGTCGSGFMSNNKDLSGYLKITAEKAGEPLWELPLWPELAKELRSDTADLKNIANPSVKAGSLVGGAFLREFIKDTPWAHFDIAGTGWNCKATGFPASGGSGMLINTLVKACLNFQEPFKK